MRLVTLAVLGLACGGGSQQQKPPAGEPAYCGGCRPPSEADKHMFDDAGIEGELVKPPPDAGVLRR